MESPLFEKKCQACEGGVAPLPPDRIAQLLPQVPGWELAEGQLRKVFPFKNYHQVIAFINATAWISHRENHHPVIEAGFRQVTMRYSTHAVGGITDNDFICAAKINQLLA